MSEPESRSTSSCVSYAATVGKNKQLEMKLRRKRNMKPCKRCSVAQKKCFVDPPYSSSLCRECAKMGNKACIPFERRIHRRRTSNTSNSMRSTDSEKTTDCDTLIQSSNNLAYPSGTGVIQVFSGPPQPEELNGTVTLPSFPLMNDGDHIYQLLNQSGLGLVSLDGAEKEQDRDASCLSHSFCDIIGM